MKSNKRLVCVLAMLLAVSTSTWSFEGRVVGVTDGDTITVLDAGHVQHKIRLASMDAPESSQAFGNRSKQNLSALVFGKQVQIPDSALDRFGRTVSRVFVGQMDAGYEQIKAGYAWHYKLYSKNQNPIDRLKYSTAEINAKAAKLGLWQDADPVRPDLYRHDGKQQTVIASANSDCPCGSAGACVGPRGGKFCVAENGKKRYNP